MNTDGTPSPQIKESGSNKRIMTEQGGPSVSRPQPQVQSPEGPSSEAHGQDGISATNTATPNNNPKVYINSFLVPFANIYVYTDKRPQQCFGQQQRKFTIL